MKPQEKCCQISLSWSLCKRSISWPRRPFIRVDFVVSELCPENSAFSLSSNINICYHSFYFELSQSTSKRKVNWYYDYWVNFFYWNLHQRFGHPNKMFSFPSSDRPIFFFEIEKKKFQIRSSKKRVLYFTSTRPCFINNWNDVMSLSLINVYTTSFIKRMFRHLIVVLIYIIYHLIIYLSD